MLNTRSCHTKRYAATARHTSSAICRAFSSGQPTSSRPNSSPPMRATVSESRTASRSSLATSRSMAVAGQVPARVVDDLEAVQIEVTQHVRRLAAARGLGGFLEPPLELAPVHQPGERIVRRLVRHLPVQAAQLGHVMQQHHGAGEFAVVHRAAAMRRSRWRAPPPRTCRATRRGGSGCADCRCRRPSLP